MLNLAQLETDLAFLLRQADELRLREGPNSPNFLAVNNEILKLNAIREEALQSRNTLSFNPNIAYTNNSQANFQQQPQVMFPTTATSRFQQPAVTTHRLDDNKYASRAGALPKETVQATVVASTPEVPKPKLKAKEGDEYPHVCYQGIKAEKEYSDDKRTFKYVLYGDAGILDMDAEKVENLSLPCYSLPELRKMVLGLDLRFAMGGFSKAYYSKVTDIQLGTLVNKLKSIDVTKTSVDSISADTSRLLSGVKKYYASVVNMFMKGLRDRVTIEDFGSDLPELKQYIDSKPLDVKVKFNKFMTEIQNEFNSNLSIEFIDDTDVAVAKHTSSVFFVEDGIVLGNIYEVLDESDIVSVKQDSNPILFKMLTAMMSGSIDGSASKSHVIISHCNYEHEYFAFVVVRDVFDRFIISRIHL